MPYLRRFVFPLKLFFAVLVIIDAMDKTFRINFFYNHNSFYGWINNSLTCFKHILGGRVSVWRNLLRLSCLDEIVLQLSYIVAHTPNLKE